VSYFRHRMPILEIESLQMLGHNNRAVTIRRPVTRCR
jgi:hypothetical protein